MNPSIYEFELYSYSYILTECESSVNTIIVDFTLSSPTDHWTASLESLAMQLYKGRDIIELHVLIDE